MIRGKKAADPPPAFSALSNAAAKPKPKAEPKPVKKEAPKVRTLPHHHASFSKPANESSWKTHTNEGFHASTYPTEFQELRTIVNPCKAYPKHHTMIVSFARGFRCKVGNSKKKYITWNIQTH